MASARGAGNPGGTNADLPSGWAADRTRPLCAYPKVARYKGTGSLELAERRIAQGRVDEAGRYLGAAQGAAKRASAARASSRLWVRT